MSFYHCFYVRFFCLIWEEWEVPQWHREEVIIGNITRNRKSKQSESSKTIQSRKCIRDVRACQHRCHQDGVVSYTTDETGSRTSQNLIGLEGNIIGTQRYTSDTTNFYSYNKDIQGSTTSLVKEDGTADATYTYTDFGETTIGGSNEAKNEVCYTGGIYDSSTGQYYLNARYYNPEDGRFLTEDTYRGETAQPDTQNLYAYCAGNPVNYVDPSGHRYYMESNVSALRVCTDGKIANKYEAKREKDKKMDHMEIKTIREKPVDLGEK